MDTYATCDMHALSTLELRGGPSLVPRPSFRIIEGLLTRLQFAPSGALCELFGSLLAVACLICRKKEIATLSLYMLLE